MGQAMGGPWTYIAPAVGFGVGLAGDMKFMKGMHGMGHRHDTGSRADETQQGKAEQRALGAGANDPGQPVSAAEMSEPAKPAQTIKAASSAQAPST
ncbi:MAG: hypothetical protein HYY28_02870 [Betaproteobacteria bacterium]|nr:hypothetical protein [Betaproteobacteria bacterium]